MQFMEMYSPIILAIIFTIFLFKLLKKSGTSHTNAKNLPPGPLKLPFVGNLLQVAAAGKIPHRGLRSLAKKYGPVMQLQLGEIPLVVISSAKAAKQALRTNDLALADRPPGLVVGDIILENCRDIVVAPYGDYWRQMRKICTLELLSAKKVRSFRAIREEESEHLLKTIKNSIGLSFNLSECVTELANGVISRAATGKRCDKELEKIVKDILYWGAGFLIPDLFPSIKFLPALTGMKSEIRKLRNGLDRIFGKIIKEHREKLARKKEGKLIDDDAEEDLIDVLLRVNEARQLEFPLTSNDIQGVVLDMFTAGIETGSAVIEWAMAELIRDPRAMKKVQTEVREILKGKETITEDDLEGLRYLRLVIKEALRLHPPLPLLLPRQCRKECEIDGYTIPVNTKVIVNSWAIGRDPEYWDDAERFYPERFDNNSIDFLGLDYDYLPFGSGRRICPGMNFGIAGVELPLTQLLYHFDWKLPNNMKPEELDMEDAFGATNKRKNHLFLIPASEYTTHKEIID